MLAFDRRTDRQTDGQTHEDDIYCVSIASCSKNAHIDERFVTSSIACSAWHETGGIVFQWYFSYLGAVWSFSPGRSTPQCQILPPLVQGDKVPHFLSITLLNDKVCECHFAMKALEFRNGFGTIQLENVCGCATASKFLGQLFWVDLIKWVSNVRTSVHPSAKSSFRFQRLSPLPFTMGAGNCPLILGTISKFDQTGFLIFVVVFVSRDFELGRN